MAVLIDMITNPVNKRLLMNAAGIGVALGAGIGAVPGLFGLDKPTHKGVAAKLGLVYIRKDVCDTLDRLAVLLDMIGCASITPIAKSLNALFYLQNLVDSNNATLEANYVAQQHLFYLGKHCEHVKSLPVLIQGLSEDIAEYTDLVHQAAQDAVYNISQGISSLFTARGALKRSI